MSLRGRALALTKQSSNVIRKRIASSQQVAPRNDKFCCTILFMNNAARTTFQDELIKLQSLVLDLAQKVKANGELLLQFLKNKEMVK